MPSPMVEVAAAKKKLESVMRSPIVVVMGHIDHGKTTILDWYRKTKVVEEESGGITQHIGAYEVVHRGKKITFIDTPGHEAFSKLRTRGAKVADVAILVVAADEGVKPQTKEAIAIARVEHLPVVVALNKIDKPASDLERVKRELAEAEVLLESYGGKVPSVAVSAKTGEHMDELLELVLLVAELEGTAAHPERSAEGVVIEAHREARRGTTATLLILDGTLRKGDTLVMGRMREHVKILEDFLGRAIEAAGPSSPVIVAGIGATPTVGDPFRSFSAKGEAEAFLQSLAPAPEAPKAKMGTAAAEETKPIFNIILKADVVGSREALEDALEKLATDAVRVHIIRSDVGDINESDVKLAMATKLVTIVGFKVGVSPAIRELASQVNIHIRTGDVIYELLDAVKQDIEKLTPQEVSRLAIGTVKILKRFKKDGAKQIVGGKVEEGVVRRGAEVEIQRNKEVIGKGSIRELQRERQAVEEVATGLECGLLIDSETEIREGDVIGVFQEEVAKGAS